MEKRQLRTSGLTVSAIGLGCMGMSDFYGPRDDAQSIDTLNRALELGVTFWDPSDAYGPHRNEELIGRAIRGRREKITIATKFGIVRTPDDPARREISGRPEYVRSACEASLKRLGTDVIDLYYQHRVDPNTPIEDTVGAMLISSKRARSATSVSQRRVPRQFAAPTKFIRSQRCRTNILYGAATRKTKSWRYSASSESDWSPTVRSAVDF